MKVTFRFLLFLFVGATICMVQKVSASTEHEPILRESWNAYKARFISNDGRVIDPTLNQITTSEGQSYALLRSVWMDDRETFDKVLQWTHSNLERKDSGLFSWKWGQKNDKSWAVLDEHTATDADQDIAFALILAGRHWHENSYLDQSKQLIASIWRGEITECNGKAYVVAGDWAKSMEKPRLNASYLAPYIYREFSAADPDHPWEKVVNTSYDVLNQDCALSVLHLPSDWCNLNRSDSKIDLDPSGNAADYSYDAMRTPWRLAIDWQWNKEPRAKSLIDTMSFFLHSWQSVHAIRAGYTPAGVTRSQDEPIAGYGCVLPYFQIVSPDCGNEIIREKIMSQYNAGLWRPEDHYYDQNWAWFGLAAWDGFIKP